MTGRHSLCLGVEGDLGVTSGRIAVGIAGFAVLTKKDLLASFRQNLQAPKALQILTNLYDHDQ